MRESPPKDFYTKLKESRGVVEFDVKGDSKAVLRAGITIALQEHSSFEYYRVVENEDGSNELHFAWYCSTSNQDKVHKLPFALRDVEAIMLFIGSWIQENGKYSTEDLYSGDGDHNYGFRLTNKQECDWRQATDALCLRVCPEFVYYGK